MAFRGSRIALALFAAAMVLTAVSAQTGTDCTQVIISMSPCLNYIQGNSSVPSSGCCTQLASVVRSQPQCLCQVLNGGSSLGITINQTQALALPKVCNVQTPQASQCSNGGSTAPAGSPDEAPGASGDVPSGSGTNTVPSTDTGSSDAASIKMAAPLMFFLLLAASYVSMF